MNGDLSMEISRISIIQTLQKALEKDSSVLAAWLEGADALGAVDEYSDIDFNCSVLPGQIETVWALVQVALQTLGELDLNNLRDREVDHLAVTFHLENTSPFLLIDLDVFVGRGSQFIQDDPIEKPLILFDHAGVIRFLPNTVQSSQDQRRRLDELCGTVNQFVRIEKYIQRGELIEALAYYQRWMIEPLIEILRMRYTPLHPDYYIVHISRHLPPEVLSRLEDLYAVCTLEELERKLPLAQSFFEETLHSLNSSIL